MAQIIDENAKICETLEGYLDSIGITKAGLNYHTLSIIGPQSSGKSTLLNNLFHCSFETMNDQIGRQQTTKGIHAAFNDQNVLIFDIEGSDSRERGDADALFERKAALFGLALSEVVMVNMWEKDIGRYNASSMPLLRTVFEVNLQLFSSSQEAKCHLLFVIRDSTHPADIIEGQVRRDLATIWREVILPPNLQGKQFDDFFVFHFFQLPHLKLEADKFKVEAAKLAAKFTDKNDKDFFFAQPMGKLIPGDGLSQYIHSVWDAISENRELNLPSQRKTLSNFKCEEFANNAFKDFEKLANESIIEKINDKPFEGFKEIGQKLYEDAIHQYNQNANKYLRDIANEKRQSLVERISQHLFPSFEKNCTLFKDKTEKEFTDYINELPAELEKSTNWEQNAVQKLEETIGSLNKFIEENSITDFNWQFDVTNIEDQLNSVIINRLDSAVADLEMRIFEKRNIEYKERINRYLDAAEHDMWERLRREMNNEIQTTTSEIAHILKKNTLNRQPSAKIASMYYRSTDSQISSASQFVQQKMIIRFEEKFLQDENHKSRVWKPDDDISAIFESARENGLHILNMFANSQLREPGTAIPINDILTRQILTQIRREQILTEFNDTIEKSYISAVQVREAMIVRNTVPLWMWIIIAIGGYQKLVSAVEHPLQTLFLILFIALVYYLWRIQLLDPTIKFIRLQITKFLKLIVKLLQHATQEMEVAPSILQNAKKSKDMDREAIKKGLDDTKIEENEKTLDTADTLDSTTMTADSSSSTKAEPTGDTAAKPVKRHRKRQSGTSDKFATLQPGRINPAELLQMKNKIQKKKHN